MRWGGHMKGQQGDVSPLLLLSIRWGGNMKGSKEGYSMMGDCKVEKKGSSPCKDQRRRSSSHVASKKGKFLPWIPRNQESVSWFQGFISFMWWLGSLIMVNKFHKIIESRKGFLIAKKREEFSWFGGFLIGSWIVQERDQEINKRFFYAWILIFDLGFLDVQ